MLAEMASPRSLTHLALGHHHVKGGHINRAALMRFYTLGLPFIWPQSLDSLMCGLCNFDNR